MECVRLVDVGDFGGGGGGGDGDGVWRWARVCRYREWGWVNGRKSCRLHGNDHEAGQSISEIRLDGGEVSIMFTLLKSDALEGRLSHDLD